VRWFLSIDVNSLPPEVRIKGQRTFRSLKLDGEEFEFSGGFTDLHTESYKHILSGEGFTLEDNRVAIETVSKIRNMNCTNDQQFLHPLAENG
jgi:UDP-N-acetyl-2-amino-2-deoxyglucuronate dehydrogenase